MKVGKTIAGNREKAESESERRRARRLLKTRRLLRTALAATVIFVILALVILLCKNLWAQTREEPAEERETTPTVEIVDEANVGAISTRIREFVAVLEQDFRDLGYEVDHVVLPVGTSREVDVYLKEVAGYFKTNIDRGTAVTAEDAVRMIKFLKGKKVGYVDVRVEGRAYYK